MEKRKERILLCLCHMSGNEMKHIQEAFDDNWVVPLGPNVDGFEKDLEAFCGQDKRIVALSSGTAAVHLALIACGVNAGDEVCVQSFTFCASSNPITYLGAKPIFIDSEKDSWNIDPDLLEEAINDRIRKTGKKPKAIIAVALYGMPYQCDRIMDISQKYDIPVIEDAAEGFGSKWNGRMLGTFGKYGVLSFNGNKMITTSGGGALITSNDDEWKEIMMYATQYRESFPYYQHEKIGFNYRMSNISAGIGRGQMTIADNHIAHHKKLAALYSKRFSDIDGIAFHQSPSDHYDSNYWLNTITVCPDVHICGEKHAYCAQINGAIGGAASIVHSTSVTKTDCQPNDNIEALRVYLDTLNIESRPLWKPMHKQPVYSNTESYINGTSEEIFKQGLCLPSGPYVSEEDANFIVDAILEAIEK